jgi:geranylgeranyl reductase family protein
MHIASEHDVIVVGAGPAGATTATALAQQGHDVLLIDRQTFPRDKVCGDAISQGCIRIMNDLGMAPKIEAAVARGELYHLDGMRLIGPSGHTLQSHFSHGENGEKSYVAPRIYFDAIIQRQAVDSGATFLQAEVKEPLIEEGRVVGVTARQNGETKAYRASVVVDAGGVTSAIMRSLRPEPKQHVDKHRAVALRAYIKGLEIYPHEVEFFLYDEILPGYAWIFPVADDEANIGLGMRLDRFRKQKGNLKKMLKEFLEMPAICERAPNGTELRDVAIWQLSFGSQKKLQHAYDGALLVGDAAGFINPLTGGGIHNALISGVLAADTIEEALRAGDYSRERLKIYETRCDEEMWDDMRKSFLYQRVLLNYPGVVDFLVRYLGRHGGVAQTFLSKL